MTSCCRKTRELIQDPDDQEKVGQSLEINSGPIWSCIQESKDLGTPANRVTIGALLGFDKVSKGVSDMAIS